MSQLRAAGTDRGASRKIDEDGGGEDRGCSYCDVVFLRMDLVTQSNEVIARDLVAAWAASHDRLPGSGEPSRELTAQELDELMEAIVLVLEGGEELKRKGSMLQRRFLSGSRPT